MRDAIIPGMCIFCPIRSLPEWERESRGGGVGEERVGVEREGVIVGEWGSGGMHEAARDGWVWGWKICIRI